LIFFLTTFSCRIQFNICHQQITEGNLILNIDRCWNQIGDNAGRKEPGTSEINYANVLSRSVQ